MTSQSIQTVKYSHDAIIDAILANPSIRQGELAKLFGFSGGHMSRIMTSDAFQARLAERKKELIDPAIAERLEERWSGLEHQSLEILANKLEATQSADLALKTAELAIKAKGYGARDRPSVTAQFVVQMPGKMTDSEQWAQAHRPGGAVQEAIEVESRGVPPPPLVEKPAEPVAVVTPLGARHE